MMRARGLETVGENFNSRVFFSSYICCTSTWVHLSTLIEWNLKNSAVNRKASEPTKLDSTSTPYCLFHPMWICEMEWITTVGQISQTVSARASIILDMRSVRALYSHTKHISLINMHRLFRLAVVVGGQCMSMHWSAHIHSAPRMKCMAHLQVPRAFKSFRANQKLIYYSENSIILISASHSCAENMWKKTRQWIYSSYFFFCIRWRCAWLENRFRAERNPVIIIFQLELHSPHSSVLIFHFLRFVSIFRSLIFCCLASTFE